MKKTFLLLLSMLAFASMRAQAQNSPPHRVIVLTDIEADPDDTQSLVRLLLYANEIDIKGIVATTSCWKKTSIAPESIQRVIRAYGKVHGNLLKHHAGYPAESQLMSLVREGLPLYGMLGVGDGKDSEGSDWILKVLEEDDDRPLWISVWGGVNTLAQTLFKIEKEKSISEAKRLISKLRVYTISDQDDSGIWIRSTFPDLFYIVSPGDHYGSATWNAIVSPVEGIDNSTISNAWLANNIQQGHGPLGNQYPDVAWGMEGDTPAFLSLIPNGLNQPDRPDLGGWGGRYELYLPEFAGRNRGSSGVPFEAETRAIWTDAVDHYTPMVAQEHYRAQKTGPVDFEGNKVSLWRWRDDFQKDFAARMDWCTGTYAECNHPPLPALDHEEEFTVNSGEGFALDGLGSVDPDGDHISYAWFNYPEAGSLSKEIKVIPENSRGVWVTAPEVEKVETAHFILKVTDKGTPALSRYKRVIVTILPN